MKPYLKKKGKKERLSGCLTVYLAHVFGDCALCYLLGIATLNIVLTTHLFPQVPARLGG